MRQTKKLDHQRQIYPKILGHERNLIYATKNLHIEQRPYFETEKPRSFHPQQLLIKAALLGNEPTLISTETTKYSDRSWTCKEMKIIFRRNLLTSLHGEF